METIIEVSVVSLFVGGGIALGWLISRDLFLMCKTKEHTDGTALEFDDEQLLIDNCEHMIDVMF